MNVLIAHPRLGFGGSEVVVAWIAQALAAAGMKVTLATAGETSLARLDALAGTDLAALAASIEPLGLPPPFGGRKCPDALRGALFARQIRKLAPDYDVTVSGYEYLPFGRPGLHYVHGDSFDIRGVRYEAGRRAGGLFHRRGLLRSLYLGLCGAIGGYGRAVPGADDVLIVNSHFTRANVLKNLDHDAEVIHPPVPATAPGLDWAARENTVVMLGRVEPSKRIAEGVGIIEALRGQGHALRLRIVGPLASGASAAELRELARTRDWIEICGAVRGAEKRAILSCSRYLLHCKRAEPFGIALAEAARSGCLCLAPLGGGYADFIADDGLLYRDFDDAVAKFGDLLGQKDTELVGRQARLRQSAEAIGSDFEARMAAAVRDFAHARAKAA